MVVFIVWPDGRSLRAALLNVCRLLSHQSVYPGVSSQQCLCTMWLWLQPQASYSLSFSDLSCAYSHQSAWCNSMPRFLLFFPSPFFVSIQWLSCLCCTRPVHACMPVSEVAQGEEGKMRWKKKKESLCCEIALVISIALRLLIIGG